MERQAIGAAGAATDTLLNSGSLVIAALLLFIAVLLVIIIWLFHENRRLTDVVLDLQAKMIRGFENQAHQLELLQARLGRNGG